MIVGKNKKHCHGEVYSSGSRCQMWVLHKAKQMHCGPERRRNSVGCFPDFGCLGSKQHWAGLTSSVQWTLPKSCHGFRVLLVLCATTSAEEHLNLRNFPLGSFSHFPHAPPHSSSQVCPQSKHIVAFMTEVFLAHILHFFPFHCHF